MFFYTHFLLIFLLTFSLRKIVHVNFGRAQKSFPRNSEICGKEEKNRHLFLKCIDNFKKILKLYEGTLHNKT